MVMYIHAKLQEKDFIYYRFDFGDDWMHRLCLEKIYPLEAAAIGDEPYAVIVKKSANPPRNTKTKMTRKTTHKATRPATAGLLLLSPAFRSDASAGIVPSKTTARVPDCLYNLPPIHTHPPPCRNTLP